MALDPDRKALADAARGVSVGDPAVDDAAREMERFYDAAQQDKAAKKFKDSIQKLDEIAKVHEKTAKVRALRKRYETERPNAKSWVDSWAGLAAAVKNLLKDKLDEANAYYTDSDVATTKDYAESLKKLDKFWNVRPFIEKEIPVVQQYGPKLTAFEAKLKEFKDHDGASGIQVIILKMEADLASAKAEAVLHKYSTALTLLDASLGDWPAATAQADACKAYKEKRVAVQGKIDPAEERAAGCSHAGRCQGPDGRGRSSGAETGLHHRQQLCGRRRETGGQRQGRGRGRGGAGRDDRHRRARRSEEEVGSGLQGLHRYPRQGGRGRYRQ